MTLAKRHAVIRTVAASTSKPKPNYIRIDSTFNEIAVRLDLSSGGLNQTDLDLDSSFIMKYRKKGTNMWFLSAPPMRAWPSMICNNATLNENYWSAACMFLNHNTTYQVKTYFLDPDVGTAVEDVFDVTTKNYMTPTTNYKYVATGVSGGDGSLSSPWNITEAASNAAPGYTFILANGTYPKVTLSTSGTFDQPITWQAENPRGAVFDDSNASGGHGIQVSSSNTVWVDYQIIDGIKFQNCEAPVKIRAAKYIEVKNCEVYVEDSSGYGIICWQNDTTNNNNIYIHHNYIEGTTAWQAGAPTSDSGIRPIGNENVICYNTLKKLSGGVMYEGVNVYSAYLTSIHNNDFSQVYDPLEVDKTRSNTIIYHNRCFNVRNGFSLQGIIGGPVYIFRNLVYNTEVIGLKTGGGDPANIVFVNNTIITTAAECFMAASSLSWTNSFVKNNAFICDGRYTRDEGGRGTNSIDDWSYNAWYTALGSAVVYWDDVIYNSLSAWETAVSEVHDNITCVLSDFEDVSIPASVSTVYDPDNMDATLTSGSDLRNAGVFVPNMQDFEQVPDASVDIGCYEYGQDIPLYGSPGEQAPVVEDSYSVITTESYWSLYYNNQTHRGQSWQSSIGGTLHDARVVIQRNNAPPGNCYLEVYAKDPATTHGVNAKPTGAALATSDAILANSTNDPSSWITFTFSGANRIEIVDGTVYILVLKYDEWSDGNYLDLTANSVTGDHAGNPCWSYDGSTWYSSSEYDFYFEVRTIGGVAPPYIPTDVSINNANLTVSGNRARVTWEVSTLSSIPSTWKIERQKDGGSWVVVESAYSFTGNLSQISWNTWLPYIYYMDNDLASGSYKYRISAGDSETAETNAVVTGTTYYVSNSGSSDSYDGLSPTYTGGTNGPWATAAKANGARSAGDLVLFKRGSTFNESSGLNLSGKGNGTATRPIKWGAYDSGNLPILNLTSSTGLNVYNVSHWVFDELDFQGATKWLIYIYATTGQTVQNIKFLRCDIDYSALTQGFSGGLVAFEQGWSNAKTSTATVKDIEVGYCDISAPNLGITYKSAVKPFSCTSNMHCHNTFMSYVPAGYDCAGGDDHRMEYCVTALHDYPTPEEPNGTIQPESSKWHSQQRWIVRPVCRHNLVYDSEAFGIAFESTQFGLTYGNTIYTKDSAYSAHQDSMFWNTPQRPHRGNFHTKNICYYAGSWGGSKMMDIADAYTDNRENFYGCPKDEWYKTLRSEDNCYYKTIDSFVMRYDTYIGVYDHWDTETEFNDNFAAYTEGDINDDPLFTNISTKDFTLQGGSPCPTWGYTEPPPLDLNLLYAFVTDLDRNVIWLMYDKDLDETLTDTTLFSPSGGKTVSSVLVEKYMVKITVNSDYAPTDTITLSYTAGATNKIKHFNLDAANLSGQAVDNNMYSGLSEELTENGDFTDGWSAGGYGENPDGWTVPATQDSDDYVDYHFEWDANGYTTYCGARIKRTSLYMYMRKIILDGSSQYEIAINIAKMTGTAGNVLSLTGFTSNPQIHNQGTTVNGAHSSGTTVISLNATIDTDFPPTGLVDINGTEYMYVSYSGSTITLSGNGLTETLSGGETATVLARGVFYFTRTANSTQFGMETLNVPTDVIIRWVSVRKILT